MERFKKPSLVEIAAYVSTRETKIDPEAFFDHYQANGWKVGKVPMADWQAAVRTWERKERERHGVKAKPVNGHAQLGLSAIEAPADMSTAKAGLAKAREVLKR